MAMCEESDGETLSVLFLVPTLTISIQARQILPQKPFTVISKVALKCSAKDRVIE